MTNYLTKEEVIEINKNIREKGVVVNEGALENILERMKITKSVNKSAVILFSDIVSLHVFLDGNKRTALASTIVFLKLNGFEVKHTKGLEEEAVSILYKIAQNNITRKEVEKWLKKLVK